MLRERWKSHDSSGDTALAIGLTSRLVLALGRLTTSSANHIRANCFALCCAFRSVILALAYRQSRKSGLSGATLRAHAERARGLITYHPRTRPGNTTQYVRLFEVRTELSKAASKPDLLTVIEEDCTTSGDWLSAREVEFAKQCGECEDSQGALDLVGRFVDSHVARAGELDLKVGVLYSQMAQQPSCDADTPYDLTCAVACQTTGMIVKKLDDLRTCGRHCGIVSAMMDAYEAAGPLFIAYMETVFLAMGLQGALSLPKAMEEHDRPVEPTLDIQPQTHALVELYQGPTIAELQHAARSLGLSWQDLRLDNHALLTIARAYRREALIVHPDKPLGAPVAWHLVQGAREILDEYFGEKQRTKQVRALTS